jgi:methionyl-tRNA synthetase
MEPRKLLVTAALPYANGPIHVGHLVEYIQTDIWVRFQRLRGHNVLFVCADDTHGTAIMIRARKEGRSEAELIEQTRQEHIRDFAAFQIEFDHYGSTNSEENRQLCHQVWASLRAADLVTEREVSQLFDPEAGTFLADRFVRGTCPKCKRTDQPGDSCECGHTYSPTELIDPVSVLSGATPELRSAQHLFVELEKLHPFLDEWTQEGDRLQPEVANYLKGHFLQEPLRDWDISRPEPYFGFEIPDSPGNFWYVWFDAPIGYIASTQQWCDANNSSLDEWWRNPDTEIHHFLGKDITYFHTLFWPAMLKTAGFESPTKIHIHGFLTVGGEKMSKSKGTFIKAATYLEHLEPSYFRYYIAAKLGARLDDLDLSLDELVTKINSDLVGKVVNLASRTARFVKEIGLSDSYPDDGGLFEKAAAAGDEIAQAYEKCEYNRAMRLIMELADQANPFVESKEPWTLKKDPEKQAELQDVCTVALNLFRQLAIYLAPVLPQLAEQTGALLGDPITNWEQSKTPLTGTAVNKFKHMMQRVEAKDVEAMVASSKAEFEAQAEAAALSAATSTSPHLAAEPIASEISFDDFSKIDLRVAEVLTAEEVPKADKLLKVTLGLGGEEQRTVIAGIKQAYKPESLVGRKVIMVANLAPRKMKFGVSEGMIIAAGPGGEEIYLLSPDDGAEPGQRVR